MQLFFHTGTLYGKSLLPNSTPQSFGTLQSVSIDLAFTTKELFGQGTFPVAVGQGNCKITGKSASANIQARLFNDLFLGGTLAAGETVVAANEAGTVPAVTTFTVTPVNSATFVEDLEVKYALTGLPFVKVASAPAIGQYSVAPTTGILTFAAADASVAILYSYSYTKSTSGQKVSLTNQLVGAAPAFKLVLGGGYGQGLALPGIVLYSCTGTKLSFATKQNDFAIPGFEFSAFADASGRVMDWSSNDGAG